jgi:catechol 2,3-dioxygenase-like lactoylglutathione lyase family enzyme
VICALDHVGISVANLDRSIEFYRKCFGMELVAQAKFEGAYYEEVLGLKGARGKVAVLKAGDMRIELFEFSQPAAKSLDPHRPVCDHGISHFCVEVTDIEGEYERLKRAGVSFHCAPVDFDGSAKATYARDPDGNAFELRERGYTSEVERRVG